MDITPLKNFDLTARLAGIDASIASATVTESSYLLYDDFTLGAQGPASGRTPSVLVGGGSWIEKNVATDAPVGGAVTTPGVSVITAQGLSSTQAVGGAGVYCVAKLASVPGEVGFTFTLADNANQYTPTVALWNGGQFVSSGVGGLHMQIKNINAPTNAQTGWNPCYYQGGTGVVANPWDEEGSGYTLFNQVPGQVYTCRIFPLPPFVYYVVLDAGGNVLSTKLAYNSNITGVIGPWFFIETFNTQITYKQVWARAKSSSSTSIRQFLGGIDGTPIGARQPATGVFSTLHVGAGQPQGIFGVGYNGLLAARPGISVGASAVGDAIWEVKAQASASGYAAQLWTTNWQNQTAVIKLDNSGNQHFIAPNDFVGGQVDWFGKNLQKTPYLMALPAYASDAAASTGGVGLNELYWSSTVNAIVQRRV